MNEKDVDLLRDAALKLESYDLDMALSLMLLAKKYRPHGKIINQKIKEIEQKTSINNGNLNIHLGVHKTATTFIQDNISISNKKNNGVIFYTPLDELREEIKKNGFKKYLRNVNWSKNVLISDENLIGGNETIYSHGRPYPDLSLRVKRILSNFKNREKISVHITIRPMVDFIPSQYCEYLRFNKFVQFSNFIEKCKENITNLSWFDCLSECINNNPDIQFTIYDFESIKKDMLIPIKSLSFGTVNEVNPSVGKSRQSFNYHDIYKMNPSNNENYKNNFNKFSPFEEKIKDGSIKTYKKDIEKLKKLKNVTLI